MTTKKRWVENVSCLTVELAFILILRHLFFPRDKKRRKIWIENMEAKNVQLVAKPVICIYHFEEHYLIDHVSRVTLKKNAQPTIRVREVVNEVSKNIFKICFIFSLLSKKI